MLAVKIVAIYIFLYSIYYVLRDLLDPEYPWENPVEAKIRLMREQHRQDLERIETHASELHKMLTRNQRPDEVLPPDHPVETIQCEMLLCEISRAKIRGERDGAACSE